MYDVGAHYVLDLYDCPVALLNDLDFVKEAVRKAAERASTTLLEEVSHKFHPQGVTALALLAESHLSVHTWPELRYVAADAFTCGDRADPKKACEYFVTAFQPRTYNLRRIARGPAFASRDLYEREERVTTGSPSAEATLEAGSVRN